MTIQNYAQLQVRIAELLNRDDLVAEIPGFIGLAEAEMARDLRDHWRLEKRVTSPISVRYTELPDDWQGALRISIDLGNRVQELDLMSTAAMANARRINNISGVPTGYAFTGGELELYPTPDQEYVVELLYRGGLPALSDDNVSNWMLAQAPDAYLYGSAKHSAPWLRDDPRLSMWEAFYGTAVGKVGMQGREAKHSGTGLKVKFRSN